MEHDFENDQIQEMVEPNLENYQIQEMVKTQIEPNLEDVLFVGEIQGLIEPQTDPVQQIIEPQPDPTLAHGARNFIRDVGIVQNLNPEVVNIHLFLRRINFVT